MDLTEVGTRVETEACLAKNKQKKRQMRYLFSLVIMGLQATA